jgi:hypothetical protein
MEPTSAGSLLFQLPSEVAGNIITQYLTLKSVSQLDVACCARTERTFYFGALRNGGRLSDVIAGKDVIDWVIRRNLMVGSLKLRTVEAIACLAAVVSAQQIFATIDLLTSRCMLVPSELQAVLALLSGLERKVISLSVRQGSEGRPLPGNVILNNLLTFTAECHADTSEWIATVINRNAALRSVTIFSTESLSVGVFAALLARRTTLTDLSLSVTDGLDDALFGRVAACCPNLQSPEIGRVETDELVFGRINITQGVVSLAQGCPGPRKLTVFNALLFDDAANQAMLRGLKKPARAGRAEYEHDFERRSLADAG